MFDRASGKQSYVYRLTTNRYPRFHVYVEEETEDSMKLHLHLDNKQHGWGERRHDSDYDSEQVKAEGARLQRWMLHFTKQEVSSEDKKEEKSLFSRLFG